MISIFHTMMLNAYILQTHNDDPQMPRLALITNVIEALASEHLPSIRQVPITSKLFEKIPFVLSDFNIDKKNMCCAFATGKEITVCVRCRKGLYWLCLYRHVYDVVL